MMSWRVYFFLLVALAQVFGLLASTNLADLAALTSVKDKWDTKKLDWKGGDACGGKWVGIGCNDTRVVHIALASNNLCGELPSDITALTELQFLDLSYNNLTGALPSQIGNLKNLVILILVGCKFSGEIPQSLGSIQPLIYLSLKSNKFIGEIPSSLGNLLNLKVLDLTDNNLHGAIPVSPGLDMLVGTEHFHLGKNKLSGEIPPQLFSSVMALRHLILDHNQLNGRIPSTLGLVKSLEVVQLHRNSLSGPVPKNFNNLSSLQRLQVANNQLTGPVPDLTGMVKLSYVDMSNNSFDSANVPSWFSALPSLTSLTMQNTSIQGPLPDSLFSLSQLQTVDLKNNQINGTLDIGSNYSSQLDLIDLRNNKISAFTDRPDYTAQIILIGNPACKQPREERSYCTIGGHHDSDSSDSIPMVCEQNPCRSKKVVSPTCKCPYPYSGILGFFAPSFSSYGNESMLASLNPTFMHEFLSKGLHVASISLSNPRKNGDDYLELYLQVFPYGQDDFNRTGIAGIGFVLSHQTFQTPPGFGSFFFMPYPYLFSEESRESSNTGLIIGAAGGSVLVLLLIFAGFYGFHQMRRAERATKKSDPFASWDSKSISGGVPQLKGARSFSFQELKECTNNFSDDNAIGSGGYGKVHRGILPNGQLVAIKRAQKESMQGDLEFKTEIELLSRVHHKNLVGLVGFCFDQGEQMLIYEYIPNGTLKESLNGKTGIRLDWLERLRIALGAAQGVHYLHDLANPPIIHRDIKSNNVLLDERLNAKVADFGLSKPMGDSEEGHVVTQVKGTMGYLDPEYYMTNQLTEKSDVFSFGVLLLEILTARNPIRKGKYIVREVKQAKDPSKDIYNLETLIDPIVAYNAAPGTVERFVDLALRCVKTSGTKRPVMSEVVKEIESIMEITGLNPNAESATSTSNSCEGATKDFEQPYSNASLFCRSG